MDLNMAPTSPKSSVGNAVDRSEECLLTASSSNGENIPSATEQRSVVEIEANAQLAPDHRATTELLAIKDSQQVDESLDIEDENTNDNEDSASEISDLSDFSQESWHPVQGPIAWVQEQMRQGQSARSILENLVPSGTVIPNDVDPIMLWRLIINIVSEPPKRKKLSSINTLEDVEHLLKTCKKIIVLTGAGVSVSCGIPDFRSRDGVYARLAVDFPNLPDPQAMFDIHFFRNDPRPFFKFAKEIYPGQFKPSLCHHFIRLIESQGKLLRNYTQNIDTLEQEAGIERVIQCHGSFATATCTNCKHKVKSDSIREDIFKQVIPICPQCPAGTENAIMKPDIVFFGESLPEDFHKQIAEDKDECDLLIVIGSSLKVRPVALIPSSLPPDVPQILINRERLHYLNFDIELLGNCDDIVSELCRRLGSGWEQLAIPGPPLTEVVLSSLPTPPVSPQNQTSPEQPFNSQETSHTNVHDPKHVDQSEASNSSSLRENGGKSGGEGETSSSADIVSSLAGDEEKLTNDDDVQHNKIVVESKCNATATQLSVQEVSIPSSGSSSTLQTSTTAASLSDDSNNNKDCVDPDNSVEETSTTCADKSGFKSPGSCKDVEKVTEVVSSTSTSVEHKHNEDHHHHHHSHHHHPHHHHHNHHHHHRHKHHHHHHDHQKSPLKNPATENCPGVEPEEKRPRLEETENEAITSNSGKEPTSSSSATVVDQKDEREQMEDDELEAVRKMWQGRRNRISLAQRLAENQFLFLPPSRYVFKGAEVFSDDEDDDDDDEDDNNAGNEDNHENNSLELEGEQVEGTVEEDEEAPSNMPTEEVQSAQEDSMKTSLSTSHSTTSTEKGEIVLSANVNDGDFLSTANNLESKSKTDETP